MSYDGADVQNNVDLGRKFLVCFVTWDRLPGGIGNLAKP